MFEVILDHEPLGKGERSGSYYSMFAVLSNPSAAEFLMGLPNSNKVTFSSSADN